ncbi:putative ferric-chelate reductase 1 [Symphorus nematophorus]
MERVLILLFAALMVYVAPGVRGTAHLSFASDSTVNITRDGCGVNKLCVADPNDCDPAGNGTCLFASVAASAPVAPSGSNLSFELRGESTGYIALGLTLNASQGATQLFICAQNSSNNASFFFRTMMRNNSDGQLVSTETRTTEIRGLVEGNVIQCEFNVPNVNATNARNSEATTFTILLGNGTFDGNSLGPFSTTLNSGPLNLANPASNVATTAMPSNVTTAAVNSTTTGSSGAVHSQAVLLLSVLPLSFLLRA